MVSRGGFGVTGWMGGGGRGLHVSKEMGIKRGGKGDDTPFCTMSCIAYLEIDVLNYSTIVLSH